MREWTEPQRPDGRGVVTGRRQTPENGPHPVACHHVGGDQPCWDEVPSGLRTEHRSGRYRTPPELAQQFRQYRDWCLDQGDDQHEHFAAVWDEAAKIVEQRVPDAASTAAQP